MSSYVEQLRRVERYLSRIEDQNRDSTEYDDDLWSFFQNCWHLKDWIKNDPLVPTNICKTIEKVVQGYPNIIICSDLAIRTKHLTPRNPKRARFTQRNVIVGPATSTSEHIITLDDGTKAVALEVARKAVKEWGDLLKANGLST